MDGQDHRLALKHETLAVCLGNDLGAVGVGEPQLSEGYLLSRQYLRFASRHLIVIIAVDAMHNTLSDQIIGSCAAKHLDSRGVDESELAVLKDGDGIRRQLD